MLADPRPFAREPASKVWGTIHGTSILLATVAVLLGFAAGVTYLGQRRRLRRKHGPLRACGCPAWNGCNTPTATPSSLAVFMLGIGIVSGVVLNSIRHANPADRLPWNDPVVLATTGMFAWLLIAVAIGHLHRPAWQGRKVAYLTVASFVVPGDRAGIDAAARHATWKQGGGRRAEGGRSRNGRVGRRSDSHHLQIGHFLVGLAALDTLRAYLRLSGGLCRRLTVFRLPLSALRLLLPPFRPPPSALL